MNAAATGHYLLQVSKLTKTFFAGRDMLGRPRNPKLAVDGVNLELEEGETLGIVGESGCGKSTLSRLILQLIDADAGSVKLAGKELRGLPGNQLRRVRQSMQLVFQDPYSSLNPRMTVGRIIEEGLLAHGMKDAEERKDRVEWALRNVAMPVEAAARYPHEFSGGQRQRVAIARALALRPRLLVADEPVSALDVSVQAQVLNLLAKVRETHSLGMIFVAHDIAVVEHVSDRIAVMYAGRIVESGRSEDIVRHPLHPYTQTLIASIPAITPRVAERREAPPAAAPDETARDFRGCAFYSRCPRRSGACTDSPPPVRLVGGSRTVACVRVD
jgi:oligopeptide/dipeptide ABC transporter ATP-binding protein